MGEQPAEALFACTKCHTRHAFDDLSHDDMLCKNCHDAVATVKCTYCREEFQLPSEQAAASSICKKCQNNVKLYGKPSACEYCNIVAAFIGSRCQRCTNSEGRWGPPIACEQCRQRCAFRRPDDSRRKVDGRTLCWLCTLSYKRVKARTRKKTNALLYPGSTSSHASRRQPHHASSGKDGRLAQRPDESHRRRRRDDTVSSVSVTGNGTSGSGTMSKSPMRSPKKPKMERSASTGGAVAPSAKGSASASSLGGDATLSENMITITRLQEENEALKKQLFQKDQQILASDRKLTEEKARNYEMETQLRGKINGLQKSHMETTETLQAKNKDLMMRVAALSKMVKKTS